MREVLDALHAPLEAGGDQAGLSSGDEAAPPPSDHRDAGPRGRSSRAAPQLERRPEPGHSVDRCAPEDALRGASLPAFVNGGGVAARFAIRSAGAVVAEPSPGEALQVSDEAVLALFGRDRAALLRVIGAADHDASGTAEGVEASKRPEADGSSGPAGSSGLLPAGILLHAPVRASIPPVQLAGQLVGARTGGLDACPLGDCRRV